MCVRRACGLKGHPCKRQSTLAASSSWSEFSYGRVGWEHVGSTELATRRSGTSASILHIVPYAVLNTVIIESCRELRSSTSRFSRSHMSCSLNRPNSKIHALETTTVLGGRTVRRCHRLDDWRNPDFASNIFA